MSKFEILLALLQMFGPVVKDAWPLILELFGMLDKVPKDPEKRLLGRARLRARRNQVNEAQKQEVYRLAEEAGISKEAVDQAVGSTTGGRTELDEETDE